MDRCRFCGCDIRRAWDSKDYVDKLIAALHHPVHDTAIRAAWILGRLKTAAAVGPLAEMVSCTDDIYLAAACAQALAAIGTPEAVARLEVITRHPSCLVRAALATEADCRHLEQARQAGCG